MQERLRVLHLITGSIRYDYLSLIADHTDRSTIDLCLGSLEPPGELQVDAALRGVSSFSLDARKRSDYPRALASLVTRLRRDRIDVVQTHLFEAQLVGLVAARVARTPLIVMTAHHSHELPLLGARLPMLADWVALRLLSHRVIAPSAEMATTLIQVHGVSASRVAVVPHGFTVQDWTPSSEARERVREELGIGQRTLAGAVGRIHWIKGYEDLLRAHALVVKSRPDVVLAIVGGGDASGLAARAEALGIGASVLLLGHRWDIPDLMDAFDVFVHPAHAESFGLVIAEAMVKGKPIVSTRVGAVPELLDVAGGRVVPPNDVGALADALADVIDRPESWSTMGATNRRRALELDAEAMVAKMGYLYRQWLANP
jgi:glycosyltransferase involved in cell wall biosynthesis